MKLVSSLAIATTVFVGYHVSEPVLPFLGEIIASFKDPVELGKAIDDVIAGSLCTLFNQSVHSSQYPIPTTLLEENYTTIYEEYEAYRASQKAIMTFDELDEDQGQLGNHWQVLWLKLYGRETCLTQYFPKTMQLIQGSQLVVQSISISRLGPNKSLPRHAGPTSAIFRYLMAVKVTPTTSSTNDDNEEDNAVPYLEVWDSKRDDDEDELDAEKEVGDVDNATRPAPDHILPLEEGRPVIFDDGFYHASHNPTDNERIALLMDLSRTPYDTRGWREKFWLNVIYKAVETFSPGKLTTIVTKTNEYFCDATTPASKEDDDQEEL